MEIAGKQPNAKWSPDAGLAAVTEWRASGMSQIAWCREQGIAQHRLSYWKKRCEQLHAPVECFGFTEVTQQAKSMLRVIFPGDVVVEVSSGFDVDTLRQIAEALR